MVLVEFFVYINQHNNMNDRYYIIEQKTPTTFEYDSKTSTMIPHRYELIDREVNGETVLKFTYIGKADYICSLLNKK